MPNAAGGFSISLVIIRKVEYDPMVFVCGEASGIWASCVTSRSEVINAKPEGVIGLALRLSLRPFGAGRRAVGV